MACEPSTFVAYSHELFTLPFGVVRRLVALNSGAVRLSPMAVWTFSRDMPVAADTACVVTSLTRRSKNNS